jgi:hypothetical protein
MLLREQYELPHVSLTRAGRKLARKLLGEVRETAKPGVLAPDTWRALARLWEWDPTQERYLLADWRYDGGHCLGSLVASGAPSAPAPHARRCRGGRKQ